MIATDLRTNEQVEVIHCKAYALHVHEKAVYQYTHAYNNHIALLITCEDDKVPDFIVNGQYYNELFTSPEERLLELYNDEELSIQMSLF